MFIHDQTTKFDIRFDRPFRCPMWSWNRVRLALRVSAEPSYYTTFYVFIASILISCFIFWTHAGWTSSDGIQNIDNSAPPHRLSSKANVPPSATPPPLSPPPTRAHTSGLCSVPLENTPTLPAGMAFLHTAREGRLPGGRQEVVGSFRQCNKNFSSPQGLVLAATSTLRQRHHDHSLGFSSDDRHRFSGQQQQQQQQQQQ